MPVHLPTFRCSRWLRSALLSACLAAGAATAAPAPWPDAPFTYYAQGEPLAKVLADFASGFSLSLSVQPGLGGTVNGRFTSRNPTEFITRLGGVYGFTWYTHAGTLHVSKANDIVTRSLPVPGGSVGTLRQALTDLGVLEPRFGWGELGQQGVVMVSGPASYVRLVEATLAQLPPASGAQQVAVFRLRHASAEDRTIQYRDRQITQHGLASVLRDLVARSGSAGTTTDGAANAGAGLGVALRSGPVVSADSSGVLPSAARGPVAAGGEPGGAAAPAGPAAANRPPASVAASPAPSIQSDPRLNALIVQDVPERLPMYARLIEQLDVPTALIEIEAMIIDINTDKARELGISWAGRDGRTAAGFGALTQQPQAGTLAVVRGPAGAAFSTSTLVLDTGNYLVSQIRLLETNGEARVQSRPSVLTTDNIGALLDLSETFYVRLQGERVASLIPVTAGTTLRVTPRVVERGTDRAVQLTVDIEDGQIQDTQVDSLPTVRRSAVSTQAIVRPEDTLLIAGHSSDQNVESTQRVPVLGDIPGVGLLFSNRARSVQKRERLFLIKPKILTAPGQVAPDVRVLPPQVLPPQVVPPERVPTP
ncbi:MAG TPA: type III secretion system outer membrane ring subunit SctC [Ramlibacter sp.]|jgi:type III secretion protein C|uniref:type III secretion system outer membrane ring subunit SctC n=1 Tax=Ramlibacter sp. TaxID=1917967 RepID=UPI002D4F3EA7|nr:type III secretion system outer membrane ring subunit SctC [Ramlibacter sp.]HZY20523.1 type III secretion system outer membrane ring subunit SctC [Ramlibacter sp.]